MNLFHWFGERFSSRGKALKLYRRGMVRAKRRDHRGAVEDYTATIGLQETPPDIRAMALYNRSMVYAALEDNPKAIHDLNAVLAMKEAPETIKTEARRKLIRMKRRADAPSRQQ